MSATRLRCSATGPSCGLDSPPARLPQHDRVPDGDSDLVAGVPGGDEYLEEVVGADHAPESAGGLIAVAQSRDCSAPDPQLERTAGPGIPRDVRDQVPEVVNVLDAPLHVTPDPRRAGKVQVCDSVDDAACEGGLAPGASAAAAGAKTSGPWKVRLISGSLKRDDSMAYAAMPGGGEAR